LGDDGKRKGESSGDAAVSEALRRIAEDLRLLIELSVEEPDGYLDKWLERFRLQNPVRCWEKKGCGRLGCPAYGNPDSRCWLIAGTMCGGEVKGDFAKKFSDCTMCDVYEEAVLGDAVTEIYEHLVTLTTNLKQSVHRLRTMAVRDPLTGLYNRNYFNETISREIKAVERYGRALSIIIVDIDNFKRINDTYGHLHGDGVLRECAGILQWMARSSDIVCRFGGDEFLVVTPEVACDEDHPLVERIEAALAEWNESYGSAGYELSFSFGCANFSDGRELHEVIMEADRKMFEDKRRRALAREGTAKPGGTP